MHCLLTRNTCWLRYSMVPESLVFLIATSCTLNLIDSSVSGITQTAYISKTTTTPLSQQTSVGQQEKGPSRREAVQTAMVMTDTSFKGSQTHVKRVRKKLVKRTKKPGLMRNSKNSPQKPTKSVSANKRIDKGRTGKPYERQAQGNILETGSKSQSQVRKARSADYDDYYDFDGGKDDGYGRYNEAYDYDEECDPEDEKPAEGGENGRRYPPNYNEGGMVGRVRIGSLTRARVPFSTEERGMDLEDVSRRRTRRACRKQKATRQRRKNRWRGKGRRRGMRLKERRNRKRRPSVRRRLDDYDDMNYYDDVNYYDYGYDEDDDNYEFLQRTKRESETGGKGPQADAFDESLGLIPALNRVRDSWASFRMKPRAKTAQTKRTGARSINRTTSHLQVLGAKQNKTAVPRVEWKRGEGHGAGRRITPSVTAKQPVAPVLIALCAADKVCANGGTCLQSATGRIICICATGYSGKTCENRTDPCTSHPCQNGATCSFDAKVPLMWCQCPSGFTGKLCQIDVNECASEPCLNGARCVDRVDGFSCRCLPGFEGQRCGNNTDDCLGRICANGGRCIDGLNRYRCQCRRGFFGRHCQRVSDACLRSPCFNGGECMAMDSRGHFYKCLCRSGYLGARCEIQAARCVHTWCQNGGTCMEAAGSFQCLCPPGLTGNLCESELSRGVNKCQPDVCQRRGKCVDDTSTGFRCECPSEAVGDRCQFDRAACLPNPCVNGGLCIPTGGPFYFCLCDQRFAGNHCQFETRPCARKGTCENGGTCLEYHLQRRRNHHLQRRSCVGEKCRVKRGRFRHDIPSRSGVRKEWTVVRCVCPVLYTGPRCKVRNLPCTVGVCAGGQECKEDPNNPVEGYSCIGTEQNNVALGNRTNWNKTVQGAPAGHVRQEMISNTAAILFGAAMIVTIFGIALTANGYTRCPCFRSKKENVYLPVLTEQPRINSKSRTRLENPKM